MSEPAPRAEREAGVFLSACRRRRVPYTPIWIMRQAGRYLPEYRALRRRVSFKRLCRTPELAAEVTVSAARRLGVDAAIVFSDLLVGFDALGVGVDYVEGEGPVVRRPVRTASDVARLRPPEPGALSYVASAVRMARRALPAAIPVVGFAGAPFTLAAYAIDGGGARDPARTRAFMRARPRAWRRLLALLARASAALLNEQIAAGASAVQLFDSWVGCLSEAEYRRYAMPYSNAVFRRLPRGVPAIHFGTGTAGLLRAMRRAGGTMIGLDWRVDLDRAWKAVGYDRGVQGNLDPAALLGGRAQVRSGAREVLRRAGGRPGHVFNLGHGVLPSTPVSNVLALVDLVHEESRRRP